MSRIDTKSERPIVADSIDEAARSKLSISNSIDADLGGGKTSSSKKNILAKNGGMILLLVVVVVAGGLLMGMRQLGLAGRLELVDIKIDYPFEKREAVVSADHQAVIDDLKSSTNVKQVPPELVQMNPFEWMAESNRGNDADAKAETERLRKELDARRKAVDAAFAKLTLNSIMGGRTPVAQISGKLVKVGDVIDEMFKVTLIEGRTVALEADGKRYVMILGE